MLNVLSYKEHLTQPQGEKEECNVGKIISRLKCGIDQVKIKRLYLLNCRPKIDYDCKNTTQSNNIS